MLIKGGFNFLWSFVLVLGLLTPASAADTSEAKATPASIVAVVNGTTISQGDFDREMIRVYQEANAKGRFLNKDQWKEIRKQVLERLIDRELLFQETTKKGVSVDKKTIDERYDNMKNRFGSEQEFKIALSKLKITESEIRLQLKKSIAIQEFVQKEFAENVQVAESDVKAFYTEHPESFKQPEQLHARHILVKVASEADEKTKKAAREKLQAVQKKLKSGADFEALAREHSEGPSAPKGGDLGYFRKGQMVKPFEEAAFGMETGQVSDIVETRFGYHLIQVVDKKPATTLKYDQVKENLTKFLKQQKVQKNLVTYISDLKEKASVDRFLPEPPEKKQ